MKAVVDQGRRSFWLKHLHQWHWISSAICLAGMLVFSATGITLNHAGKIEAQPSVEERTLELPANVLAMLRAGPDSGNAILPDAAAAWIDGQLNSRAAGKTAEWSQSEIYVPMPRPGGDAWLSIDRNSGAVVYEVTGRGWISYFNDLHKGRNTGAAWSWFIDLFAVACLVFCITGFFLLQIHARNRPATWPLAGLGIVLPLLLAILFIH